ncbi:hypothetical protein KL940_004030 [Ogataea angusta]|uniref:Uncharacterized protein n=1 Tax=Pichia angusta TaxID=870730 RepID=A0ABQ7RTC6_PICAN|nr:hypothetical protein KL940_004030 [Ogataea angusta]
MSPEQTNSPDACNKNASTHTSPLSMQPPSYPHSSPGYTASSSKESLQNSFVSAQQTLGSGSGTGPLPPGATEGRAQNASQIGENPFNPRNAPGPEKRGLRNVLRKVDTQSSELHPQSRDFHAESHHVTHNASFQCHRLA